jgi:hypothetical protein
MVFDGLPEDEKATIEIMAVFQEPVTHSAISIVGEIEDAMGVLRRLSAKGLIFMSGEVFFLHDIIRDLSLKELTIDEKLKYNRKVASYYKENFKNTRNPRDNQQAVYHSLAANSNRVDTNLMVDLIDLPDDFYTRFFVLNQLARQEVQFETRELFLFARNILTDDNTMIRSLIIEILLKNKNLNPKKVFAILKTHISPSEALDRSGVYIIHSLPELYNDFPDQITNLYKELSTSNSYSTLYHLFLSLYETDIEDIRSEEMKNILRDIYPRFREKDIVDAKLALDLFKKWGIELLWVRPSRFV